MTEMDKLRALLEQQPPPAEGRSRPNAAHASPSARGAPAEGHDMKRRRLRRWSVFVLLVVVALDAVYLLARTLIAGPH
jgi:hypothetical protein